MTTQKQAARHTLRRLGADLVGQVISPDDPEYDRARGVFLATADRRPAAVIRPADARQVARTVSLARETGLELAVRGGGHSYAGHATSEGGIVLDLSRLKALEVDPAARVARAGAGLTTGEVTVAAGHHGLAVGFGDTGSVGIGGLTLGGGVGYLARRHGLTIDNLLGADVVTADGRILRVDAEHEPELFWAIRGGGGNFGVAVRFDYRLQPVDVVTGGMLVLPATAETVEALVAEADAAPDELSLIANVMPAPPMPFLSEEQVGEPVILTLLVHSGPLDAGERSVARLRAIAPPLADFVRPLPYPEMFPDEEPMRPLATTRSLFLDSVDARTATALVDRLLDSSARMAAVQLRVLGGAVARVPADETAYAHRTRRIMASVVAVSASPDDVPVDEAWAIDTAEALQQGEPGVYVNFLGDEGAARVRAAYPRGTWERLTAVKHAYDPENLFRRNHNVPPRPEFG